MKQLKGNLRGKYNSLKKVIKKGNVTVESVITAEGVIYGE